MKQQKIFQRLEEELGKLNEEKSKLEAQLADPAFYNNKEQFQKLDEAYRAMVIKVNEKSKAYDTAFELVLELEEKIG